MKRILISALTLVIVIGPLGAGTLAWFTDSLNTSASTFQAGTLSPYDEGVQSFNLGSISNMAPGDVTDPVSITIYNDGTLPLAWFGDWVITGDETLKSAIYIESAKMEFLRWDGNTWEPTDVFITDGAGSGNWPGWYDTLAAQSPFGVVTLSNWDDNNGMGTTPYEHLGALKPGFSDKLTVTFGFAPLAGNDYQGKGPLSVQFKVDAAQVNADALDALKPGFSSHLGWLNAQLEKQN